MHFYESMKAKTEVVFFWQALMFSGSTEFRVFDTAQCLPANKNGVLYM
jgi:hypothetical protein